MASKKHYQVQLIDVPGGKSVHRCTGTVVDVILRTTPQDPKSMMEGVVLVKCDELKKSIPCLFSVRQDADPKANPPLGPGEANRAVWNPETIPEWLMVYIAQQTKA